MAVTIHQNFNDYDISGNPLVVVFSSNLTAQANFSYKVELYVNAVLVETHKLFPEVGIKAHIDVSNLAERYNTTHLMDESQLRVDADDYKTIKVKIIENYGTPPTDQATNEVSKVVFKGKQTMSEFLNYDPTDYIFASGKSWLTTFPTTEKRYYNNSYNHKLMFITDGNSVKLRIKDYRTNGSTNTVESSTFQDDGDITIFNLNATIISGLGINIANSEKFEISVFTAADTVSGTTTLWVDDRCISSNPTMIHFLSKIGSIESYLFINRTKTMVGIKSNSYEQQVGYFDDSGNWINRSGGLSDYSKESTTSIEVQTNFISEDEYNWLVDNLLKSPLIYIEELGSTPYRCRVKESSYEHKLNNYEMVFNLKAKLELTKETSTIV